LVADPEWRLTLPLNYLTNELIPRIPC